MWTFLVVAMTAALAAAWVPVGIYFWRSWRRRGAPLSLAICGLVGFQVYLNCGTWLFLKNDPRWVGSVIAIGNVLILSNFYLCFRWQKKRFPDARTNGVSRVDTEADTNPRIRMS